MSTETEKDYVNTTPEVDTVASEWVIKLTEARLRPILGAFGLTRHALVEVVMDQHPELKHKRTSVQAALYGKIAFPYLYELLPSLKNHATEKAA